jgi:hypothetical protein
LCELSRIFFLNTFDLRLDESMDLEFVGKAQLHCINLELSFSFLGEGELHRSVEWDFCQPRIQKSCISLILRHTLARHQWLTLIIPATQEEEIRRIVVRSQPR